MKKRIFKRYQFKKKFVKSVERQTVRKIVSFLRQEVTSFIMDLPPLTMKDKLFVESRDLNNPCLNRNPHIREIHLTEAYISNAILLLDIIGLAKSNAIRDGYIYPALFSFRHYLELIMKDTLNVKVGKGKVSDSVTNKIHCLDDIWRELKEYIPEDDARKVIDKLMNEISSLDPFSFNFRYTYDIRGNKIWIFPKEIEDKDIECINNIDIVKMPICIDRENLKTIILKMYNYFDGINYQVHNNIIEK